MTFCLELLDGFIDKGDELRVEVAFFGLRSLWGPIVDLRATVRELGDRDVVRNFALQGSAEAEFGAEGVIESSRAQGFPVVRCFEAASKTVFERDLVIVLGQNLVLAKRFKFLFERSFSLHIAMTGENEQLDRASFFVRPTRQWSVGRLLLSDRSQIGVRIVYAMLKLS